MEGAILQVSVPTLVPGGCWATAGETNAAASATSTSAMRCLDMIKLPALCNYSLAAHPTGSAVKVTMRFRQKSELVADAPRNLIAAEFLFEADKSKVQDRYWIHKGLGRV